MIKNFSKELQAMDSNERISEKLMIFSLYNEFYNAVLGSADVYFMEHYGPFMEKTFELVATVSNLQDSENISAEQFMKVYFAMLKKSRLSSMLQVKDILATFENELSDFINTMKYVGVIEQFDSFSLESKISIMVQFREYINQMFCTANELFDPEGSKELRHDLLGRVSIYLGEYLKTMLSSGMSSEQICSVLKPNMRLFVKECLIAKLNDGKFGIEIVQNRDLKEFFANFSELEQKVWLMGAIYGISGYDKTAEEEKIVEICELLEISVSQYMEIITSMRNRSVEIMQKMVGEIEGEKFGESSSRK